MLSIIANVAYVFEQNASLILDHMNFNFCTFVIARTVYLLDESCRNLMLGITCGPWFSFSFFPVLPAFSGNIPAAFKQIYPSAKITRLGNW